MMAPGWSGDRMGGSPGPPSPWGGGTMGRGGTPSPILKYPNGGFWVLKTGDHPQKEKRERLRFILTLLHTLGSHGLVFDEWF